MFVHLPTTNMAVKNMKPFVLFTYLLILVGITVSDDFFCNFEKDLCGFTHDSSVNGNWRRMYGSGHNSWWFEYPQTDHTYGNNTGYYMFYRGDNRNQEAARIISPNISPNSTNNYTVCVQFWYYMEGTVGDLSVYVRTNPSDLLGIPVWSLSGNRGGIWHAAQVQIQENTTTTYQVVFEGEGPSRSIYGHYDSISIDDVTIRKSYCQDTDGEIEIANVSCSFETSNNCGYRQDQSDDFNWRSRRGATDTRYTGPSQDHTLGSELGRYMYIETSQYQLIEGHKARLISPVWTITEPEQCVEFWYHMYGSDTGALSLFIRPAGGAIPADPVVRIVGHHMDVWLRHVYLMNRTGDFELVFEAICGSGIYGDISLDDVRIYDGPCANNTVEPAVVPIDFLKAGCNFEFDDICNYTQDIADVFDWRRNTGRTRSSNTGPTNDHTYTTSVGHYMYIEASLPRREGDKARLLTQMINNNNTDICLSFYYHMYGRAIDFLKIFKKDVGGGLPIDPIYVKHGNKGNVWRLEKVDVKGQTENFQIVFEGTVGNTAYGDIAIDDIQFHAVTCEKVNVDDVVDSFACDFEGNSSSLCNFEQSKTDNFDWELRNGSTHSLETGPSADHTYGNSKGQYIYIEASNPRRPGERARLTSPSIDSSDHVLCLQFWYHMKGEHVGFLKVFRYFYTEEYYERLMTIEGEQGDRWIEALIPINYDVNNGFIEERIKILITGIIGKGHLGDIAIDDVSIKSHHCFSSGESTTVTELSCDFESGLSKCGFKQSVSDVFDWTFLNASADSQDIANYSTATKGQNNFIYLDMAGRGRGDVANIATQTILPNITNRCLTFKHFMKGDAQQQLNVYILGVSGLNDFVGSVSVKNSSQWKTSQFNVSVKQDDQQIMFEGVVGFAPRGFIALDDITVKFGSCVRDIINATVIPSSLPPASSNQDKNATGEDNDDDNNDDDDENLDIVSKLFISFTLILLFMILLSVAILVVRRRCAKKSRQAKDEQQFPYATNQNLSADLAVDNPAYEISVLSNAS